MRVNQSSLMTLQHPVKHHSFSIQISNIPKHQRFDADKCYQYNGFIGSQ